MKNILVINVGLNYRAEKADSGILVLINKNCILPKTCLILMNKIFKFKK